MLIDIRSREITRLRRSKRELALLLEEIETIANANDALLLTLHKLALLLISKPANWQTQAAALLKKGFSLPYCDLLIFSKAPLPALVKRAQRLPASGKAFDNALADSKEYTGAKRYFYLPIKKEGRIVALLVFASKQADAFPAVAAYDFTRRLSELLAAAL